MPKTIGILGGMGSWATLKFFEHILSLSEPDEFRIIIDNNVTIPSRSKAMGDMDKEHGVAEGVINSFYDLAKAKVDFVTVPCNQAHYWYDRIEGLFRFLWLNMIEVVSNAVTKRGFSTPLILGGQVTVEKKLYSEYLPRAVHLSDEENELIYQAISQIKKSGDCPDGDLACEIADILWDFKEDKKCDCFLYACTELGLTGLYGPDDISIIDSSHEYAKATVAIARGL